MYTADKIDTQIINLLSKNARLSYSEIAENIGLSRTAVKARIDALEKKGLIKGYTVVTDQLAVSGKMIFVTDIQVKPEAFGEAKQVFSAAAETVTLVQTMGECRLLALCVASDVAEMKNFVSLIFNKVPGITSIRAEHIIDVIKGKLDIYNSEEEK